MDTRLLRIFAPVAVAVVGMLAVPGAYAASGDTLTYQFNAEATGSFAIGNTQATLLLTETASGVDFLLSPNWPPGLGTTTGNQVERLQFAFSGDAMTFAYLFGATVDSGAAQFGVHAGSFDGSYSSPAYFQVEWFNSPPAARFDSDFATSAWSLNGAGITLADFSILATTGNTNKPSPIFGVISMPGASPNNWVAGQGTLVTAVPEPQTYALMLAGLGVVGFVARRRSRT